MKLSTLANQLRRRVVHKGLLSKELAKAVSDDVLVWSYNYCSCCGDAFATDEQLTQIIDVSKDADEFDMYHDAVKTANVVARKFDPELDAELTLLTNDFRSKRPDLYDGETNGDSTGGGKHPK